MGCVLKLGKISSYFIKLSVREKDDLFSEIPWLESPLNVLKIPPACHFLFHTNVVKHEKEGQYKLTLKQLDAQFLMQNEVKIWFSSLL